MATATVVPPVTHVVLDLTLDEALKLRAFLGDTTSALHPVPGSIYAALVDELPEQF